MSILKFATAGSVDHGKSTLLGRILYDLNQLKEDQILALHADGELNLAFATDGLAAERAQGITIDVAYRYFSIQGKRFVSVDAPGHEEFTRNAFTAFTQVHAVILVMDILRNDHDQFFKHLALCHLLQIPNIAIAINKMDSMQFSQEAFNAKVELLTCDSRWLVHANTAIIPVSALAGDNVINASVQMPWYQGASIFDFLANSFIPEIPAVLALMANDGDLVHGTAFGTLNPDYWLKKGIQITKLNGKQLPTVLPTESGAWECSFTTTFPVNTPLFIGDSIIESVQIKAVIFNVSDAIIESGLSAIAIQTIAGLYPISKLEILGGSCKPNELAQITCLMPNALQHALYEFGNTAGRFTIVNTASKRILAGGVFTA